jgi:hypothetical protein
MQPASNSGSQECSAAEAAVSSLSPHSFCTLLALAPQGIYTAAKRFYLLFQLHTTPELATFHGYFGRNSYSQVLLFGPRLAVALPDCRAQRTETQVLAMDTHLRLMTKVEVSDVVYMQCLRISPPVQMFYTRTL